MANKCNICSKREYKIILRLNAIKADKHEMILDKDIQLCHECFIIIMTSIIDQIDYHRQKKKKGTVIPSIPWAKRIKMGKITKDEMIDILSEIKRIKNIKDFKELK